MSERVSPTKVHKVNRGRKFERERVIMRGLREE